VKRNLRKVIKRPGKGTVLSLAVAVPLAAAAGYFAPSIHDAVTLGASASSVAHNLDCTGYKQEAQHNSLYLHHDSGTCTFHGSSVRIVTFDHGADSDSFTQSVRLLGLSTKETGAFASASGWSVASTNYSLTLAQAVVDKLGGTVHALPAVKATIPATKPVPSTVKPTLSSTTKPTK
jgi:hypothetical protein